MALILPPLCFLYDYLFNVKAEYCYPPEVSRGEYWGLGVSYCIFPSCHYMKILHHNSIDMNIVG